MIPLFKVFMADDMNQVNNTLKSGFITQGKKVEEFERALKEFFNYEFILTLNSATSGLTLAFRLLNLPPKSKVLCSPFTCFAGTCSVLANNLDIIWLDIDPETCNIDLNDLKNKLTPDIKAVFFVHWGGNPVNLRKVKEIVGDVPVIEDCAHAFGAEFEGKKLGTHSNIAVYSLQAIKHLTTGDGGLIFLPNKEMYERAKLLRWYGIDRDNNSKLDNRLEADIKEWGYKFHMNDINASIGLSNLPFIQENLNRIRKNIEWYDLLLYGLNNVQLLKKCKDSLTAGWIYTIKVKDKQSFIDYMKKKNITASQVHKRNDINSCVNQFKIPLPNLDSLESQIVSIPCGWWLTQIDIEHIVKSIRDWDKSYINIRLLEQKDKEEFLTLLKELNNTECDNTKFDTIISFPHYYTYIMKINDVMICTGRLVIEYKFYDNVARIEDVVVKSKYRKHGYGKQMILFLLDRAKEYNCYKTILNTKETNIDFYKKCGFVNEGFEMVKRY